MFEDSPEAFVARFRTYAASVELFSHLEGSPLLECRAGDVIIQVFERTGPYLSNPGRQSAIVNPTTERLESRPPGIRHLEATGLGRVRAEGLVLAREASFAIVDAGIPLVVSVHGGIGDEIASGGWVAFDSEVPVHAFVLPASRSDRQAADSDEQV
jgi:hypothetical protein